MVERTTRFPHIQLKLTTEGTAASFPPGGRRQNPQTSANLSDRWGHGSRLKSSVDSLISYWQDVQNKREEEEQPSLPDAVPLILKIDPDAFDPVSLKGFGIELICELEDGYIIGASADVELSELQKKIDKFIKEEPRTRNVAAIWELLDGHLRPEYILSQELIEHWNEVKDDQIYTVDVGIASLGIKSKLSDYPKQKKNESNEKFSKRCQDWLNKRDLIYEEWDDLSFERQQEFTEFIENYDGRIISSFVEGVIPNAAKLPDSFSSRIQISGKGLKDLVFNFPYIFDVSEPDEFAEINQPLILSDAASPSFQLEPPEPNASKVCVIDGGIQERHSLLKAAIDSQNSTSWVPRETNKTADYVNNGGHGTRVAGAVLYPRTIPRSGKEKAVCWIQNAREFLTILLMRLPHSIIDI